STPHIHDSSLHERPRMVGPGEIGVDRSRRQSSLQTHRAFFWGSPVPTRVTPPTMFRDAAVDSRTHPPPTQPSPTVAIAPLPAPLARLALLPLAWGASAAPGAGGPAPSTGGASDGGRRPADVPVSLSPASAVIAPQGTFQFSATVSGAAPSTAVTWAVQEGAPGGSIDASGKYTAPGTEGFFHVVVTSVADPSRTAVSTVLVSPFTALSADRRTVWDAGG